ncbi:MAG: molybdopterin-dependent oxidoreductase [Desulfovibrionaceae bacterium]|nr:molybdopterin-dependent oxidoreductase [Desulfovibrionaceae bacterium]
MGLNRRRFITFAVGGAVGSLFTPVIWKLTDDVSIWTQNWGWIPRLKKGADSAVPTVSKLCASGCAVKVETVGGAPYGTKGNKDNPLSGGGICPLCASGAQLMNSPARVKGPMKKTGEGKYDPVSWDEALEVLAAKLKSAAGGDGKALFISGDDSGTANEVFSAFMAKLGQSGFYYMPGEAQAAGRAWRETMNGSGQVGFDIEDSDCVLFIGADALDSWGPTVRNQKAFDATHPLGAEAAAKYVYAGPVQTRTAAVCDKWVPVAPGGAAAFALGLAAILIKNGASASAADFAEFKSLVLAKFTPGQVEKMTGVKAAVLADVAKTLMEAQRPVVVPGALGGGAAGFAAGAALNVLLGRFNAKGGMVALPQAPKVVSGAMGPAQALGNDLAGYLAAVAAGKAKAPEVAMVYEANPVYALPQAETMSAGLAKAGFVVSFSTYLDETAAGADLILPAPHPYERFDDLQTPYGLGRFTYCLGAPVAEPQLDVRSTPDVILGLAAKLGQDLGFETFEDVLKAKVEAIGGNWDELAAGAAFTRSGQVSGGVSLGAATLGQAAFPAKATAPVAVAPVMRLNVGSGHVATPPHNPTTIRDTELKGSVMCVQVCKATAKQLGVSEGSKVKLTGAGGECKALVHVFEGVMPGVVAVPLGFGHTAWDEFSKGKGDNVNKILTARIEPGSGLTTWAGSTVNVAKM